MPKTLQFYLYLLQLIQQVPSHFWGSAWLLWPVLKTFDVGLVLLETPLIVACLLKLIKHFYTHLKIQWAELLLLFLLLILVAWWLQRLRHVSLRLFYLKAHIMLLGHIFVSSWLPAGSIFRLRCSSHSLCLLFRISFSGFLFWLVQITRSWHTAGRLFVRYRLIYHFIHFLCTESNLTRARWGGKERLAEPLDYRTTNYRLLSLLTIKFNSSLVLRADSLIVLHGFVIEISTLIFLQNLVWVTVPILSQAWREFRWGLPPWINRLLTMRLHCLSMAVTQTWLSRLQLVTERLYWALLACDSH